MPAQSTDSAKKSICNAWNPPICVQHASSARPDAKRKCERVPLIFGGNCILTSLDQSEELRHTEG